MKHSAAQTRPPAHGPLDGSCMDCGVDTIARGEYYALKDSVWRAINPLVIGHLCLECAEERLGRGLHRGDFSSAPINGRSARECAALAQRLERSPSAAPRSGSRGSAAREDALTKNIQRRLARKTRTQSSLGRMSAALLPYRGGSGRVPPGTMMRILRGLMQPEPVSPTPKGAPKSHR
jgi:hypothetical protein